MQNIRFYRNPVIRGFHPDPSVCRSGDDFYLVTSTFEFSPGIPVYHSRNLTDWELAGCCLSQRNGFHLGSCRSSGGLYAPTLRCHEGMFYMITTDVSREGHVLVHAKSPAGPWSEPVFVTFPGDRGSIDPSLAFEDGKVYLTCTGYDEEDRNCILMTEIDPMTGQVLRVPQIISYGSGGKFPEGPHLYKKDGWYYLMLAEGGTEYGHMETIFRSRSPYGPYEACPHNPIVDQRNNPESGIAACGHADLVKDNNGNWWMVLLGIRNLQWPGVYTLLHNLGRETMLAPVTWDEDGWPHVGKGGQIFEKMEGPLPGEEPVQPEICITDSLCGGLSKGLEFGFLRDIEPENYRFTEKGLVLKGTDVTLNETASPTWIGLRQQEFHMEFSVEIRPVSLLKSGRIGVTVFYNEDYHLEIYLGRDGEGLYLGAARHVHDLFAEICHEPVSSAKQTASSALSVSENMEDSEDPEDTLRFVIISTKEFYHVIAVWKGRGSREIARASTAGFCTEGTRRMTFTGTWFAMFAEKGTGIFRNLQVRELPEGYKSPLIG